MAALPAQVLNSRGSEFGILATVTATWKPIASISLFASGQAERLAAPYGRRPTDGSRRGRTFHFIAMSLSRHA
jgi:hypothetical protein